MNAAELDSLALGHFDDIFATGQADGWFQPLPGASPVPQAAGGRVCDRCIAKKIKCDLRRPACSRCIEAQSGCVYSSTKKRPGPAKGSRRKPNGALKKSKISTAQEVNVTAAPSEDGFRGMLYNASEYGDWPTTRAAMLPSEGVTADFQTSSSGESPVSLMMGPSGSSELGPNFFDSFLAPDQEANLLHSFLQHLHSSMPLFRKSSFLQAHSCGLVDRNFILTICVITARTLGGGLSLWNSTDIDDYLKRLVETSTIEDIPSTDLTLDNVRHATLLAFYEFHQQPGEKAVMRIGKLTRKAYQCGLHQLDNAEQCPLYRFKTMTDDEIEEWRYVWWCIYCLDACSNIMASAPFLVEIESMKTALIGNPLGALDGVLFKAPSKTFLPAEPNLLPQTIKTILTSPGDCNYNICVIATTILREAATLRRLQVQNPSESLRARVAALEGHIGNARNALPTEYMDPARQIMANESSAQHFSRLNAILLIHSARVITTLPSGIQKDESEWLYRWNRTIEYCEEIMPVLSQWNEPSSSPVDPVVCIFISGILIILHLHSCSKSADLASYERMAMHKRALVALMSRSAGAWHLSRCLLASFRQFSQIATGQLAPKDIDKILTSSQGPLHENFFNVLALSVEYGG